MTSLTIAAVAGLGTFWLYTALALGWTGLGFGPRINLSRRRPGAGLEGWLRQAGLDDVDRGEFVAVVVTLFGAGGVAGYAMFGAAMPAAAIATFTASFPIAAYRHRRQVRRERALEAWPRMIEEIRLQTSSLGRSIPQALFEVGARGPEELRSPFAAAHREWLLTTDLERTLAELKRSLADPTADMACETLLIAHELGGTDLDRRLEALADDRRQDVQGRKDARSRQAGARFARIFVLAVPAGMAFAGMSIGSGRGAYQSPAGQLAVLVALALVVACWFWAGHVMRLPAPRRVFGD